MRTVAWWKAIAVIGAVLLIVVFFVGPMIPPLLRRNNIDVKITNVERKDERTVIFNGTFNGNRDDILRVVQRTIPQIFSVGFPFENRTWLKVSVYESQEVTDEEISTLIENLENPPPYYTISEVFGVVGMTMLFENMIVPLVIFVFMLIVIVLVVRRQEKKI